MERFDIWEKAINPAGAPVTEPIDTVAFVDDDDLLRSANLQTLAIAGLRGLPFSCAVGALAAIGRDFPGIVVTDVRMPGMDGLQLFRRLRDADPDLPVILVTGHGDVPMAIAALKDGAWDFLIKPFGSEVLVASVRRALETRRLTLENRRLRAAADEGSKEVLIGHSPVMERLRETIRQLAGADVDIMIEGEMGTGKELVAVLLHRLSERRAQPFVALNCGALPEALAESELFGHEANALPGARTSRKGHILGAHRGTLFLADIADMPGPLQLGLLRVLEDGEVRPIGASTSVDVDVRVIAATKGDPACHVVDGRLRDDLYYRLNVVRLRIPPLRERSEDVALLFVHFLQEAADRRGIVPPTVTDGVMRHLHAHDWPGNVRELRHFAETFAFGLDRSHMDEPAEERSRSLPERLRIFEAAAIRHALMQSEGDIQDTLDRLCIPRKTLYDKLTRYGIVPSAFRRGKP